MRGTYKRAVLKVSGEAFGGRFRNGLSAQAVKVLAGEIAAARRRGTELAVVMGGGNIVRGRELVKEGVRRLTADSAGMFATVVNGLILCDALDRLGVEAVALTAVGEGPHVERYSPDRAARELAQGRIVLCLGGTGNPFFTTDTAAALRAAELDAQVLLKATTVDAVYSADPKTAKKARRFERIRYAEVIRQGLAVMDLTAVSLCEANGIPVIVFDAFRKGNLVRVLRGEHIGTLIGEERHGP
ncbi:MAG: UMP kinase [Planctomycetota bacterium]